MTWARWLRFNLVGIAGAGVQLAALWFLAHVAGMPVVPATVAAVETAVLHNFIWHEAWTWRGLPRADRWRRLWRFHVANGFVSVVVNAVVTAGFVRLFGWPVVVANAAAIGVAATANFAAAGLWVFRRRGETGEVSVAVTQLANRRPSPDPAELRPPQLRYEVRNESGRLSQIPHPEPPRLRE